MAESSSSQSNTPEELRSSLDSTAQTLSATKRLRIMAICDTLWEVQLLDWATGRELARLPADAGRAISAMSFSPDSSQMVVATGSGALLWDLRLIRQELAKLDLDWDLPPYKGRQPTDQEHRGSQ
ncbi:MAG: hypothetical protein ACJ8FY_24305 [Gemmataceae bacterium]